MKITITSIAPGSRFFPKVGCHLFFTLKSVEQKELFTGLFSFTIYSLWECYLENKSSLGSGRGKTVLVLLTVHWLLLYPKEFSHHLCISTASFIFLYCCRFKIEATWAGTILPAQILVQCLCALFSRVLSCCLGVPGLSAFAFPSRPV